MQTRKWMSVAGALALAASVAMAGEKPAQEKRPARDNTRSMVETYDPVVKLTAAQKEQITKLEQKAEADMRKALVASAATRDELKAAKEAGDAAKVKALRAKSETQKKAVREMRAALEKDVLNVLTPDQRATVRAQEGAPPALDTRTAPGKSAAPAAKAPAAPEAAATTGTQG
jgi:Spy/CpxP family protein refolding chaperone